MTDETTKTKRNVTKYTSDAAREAVLSALATHGTVPAIAEAMNCGQSTVQYALAYLVGSGKVVETGSHRWRIYALDAQTAAERARVARETQAAAFGGTSYLTAEERSQVEALEARIKAIREAAKARQKAGEAPPVSAPAAVEPAPAPPAPAPVSAVDKLKAKRK